MRKPRHPQNVNNIQRTEAFISAWERCDIDAIIRAVANDIFYHNIPMAPIIGAEALRAFAMPLLTGAEHVEWEMHHIAESNHGAVLTERTDRFRLANGKSVTIRVMGTFEFDGNGKLKQWRDYFDFAEFESQMAS